jgi:DNA-binding transcriptional ArsR family regulator
LNPRKDLQTLDAVMSALAHGSRRQMLMILHARGGAMTGKEIADRFSCRWPTVTRHLRVLEHAGLVRQYKRGRERLYRLNGDLLRLSAGKWMDWFENPPE